MINDCIHIISKSKLNINGTILIHRFEEQYGLTLLTIEGKNVFLWLHIDNLKILRDDLIMFITREEESEH